MYIIYMSTMNDNYRIPSPSMIQGIFPEKRSIPLSGQHDPRSPSLDVDTREATLDAGARQVQPVLGDLGQGIKGFLTGFLYSPYIPLQ